ncbi:MAG: hypothetical protein D6808_01430 [Candidatus Dadabacteria bacterium]|nr:MAG: hypothetical protein D6808_01430 [Candidatus Dadabacteria bacterium]
MREPKALNIPLPEKEPKVSVGIVIAEDLKKSVRIKPCCKRCVVRSDDGIERLIEGWCDISLASGSKGGTVELTDNKGGKLHGSRLTIFSQRGKPERLFVDSITVGRGFHWEDEKVQSFTGEITVFSHKGFIVVVNTLPFEEYIASVVSSEMGKSCPADFQIAQSVAARSWAWAFWGSKHRDDPYDVCNDDDCQRYQGVTDGFNSCRRILSAATGVFLKAPSGAVCPAYYHKSCGGHLASPQMVFGYEVDGLVPKADMEKELSYRVDQKFQYFLADKYVYENAYCAPLNCTLPKSEILGGVDVDMEYFRWDYTISSEDLCSIAEDKFGLKGIKAILSIVPSQRDPSGRYCKMKVEFTDTSGEKKELVFNNQYEIRKFLHPKFLYSSAFEIIAEGKGEVSKVTLRGAGWGHGVGLCQMGGVGMALAGKSWKDILCHYYPRCEIVKAY